ncbi:TPA: diguanylate cyclase [Candidatus Poribacteria bacterium]|nr:diguanylate cyclase [Candidatus Poribacteria bacterium]HIB92454.1 diguanylate cyclase [Candidatus Poribacteria bacterium]HIC02517.1 diguanylate cyclase [Candidatus Poribacteria bacterium]HIN29659.1 diguanylate cyclase [Candidatus Poribacteria bacterium]HIO50385.1 diguanylate cyclase [Candidatus Poribacteria bacterium]
MTLLTIVDKSLCALLEEILLDQGDQVVVATDLEEIRSVLVERMSPAVVLLDFDRQSELAEICQQNRQEKIDFPLYTLALVNDDQLGDLMFKEGIDDFLRLPICLGGLRVRLRAAKRILALEMELANTRKNLHHTASHDSMTGLLNHKGIINVLRQKFDLLGISDQPEPVSIVMMDLDSFKNINDTYGHLIGDSVICQTSQRLRELTRSVDAIGRYGGDEFLIVLNNCGAKDAFRLAERIRSAVEEDLVTIPDGVMNTTISVGVATVCQENGSALDLIGKADAALYKAKKDGGNRVRIAENGH